MSLKEMFSITSRSYHDLVTLSKRELFDSKKFSDVTLVTEDQKIIKAHKFILSANSDMFKAILENKEINSSTVFLRGVSFSSLLPLVEFCYTGKADVEQDCVAEFLETAADLKISEFLKAEKVSQDDPVEGILKVHKVSPEDQLAVVEDSIGNVIGIETSNNYDGKNMDEMPKLSTLESPDEIGQSLHKSIKKEIGIEDGPVKCEHCDVVCSHIGNLKRHIKNKHDGVKYFCSECDYKATQKLDIKRHKEYKHEGIRFTCDECGHKSTTKGALKIHVDSIHKKIRYPCHSCEYKATTSGSLNLHMQSKHTNVSIGCDQCNFVAKNRVALKNHEKKFHVNQKIKN